MTDTTYLGSLAILKAVKDGCRDAVAVNWRLTAEGYRFHQSEENQVVRATLFDLILRDMVRVDQTSGGNALIYIQGCSE